MNAKLVSNATVGLYLESLGIKPDVIFLGDATYALPTADWVRRFAAAYAGLIKAMNATQWLENVFDCENHAMRAVVWAVEAHRETYLVGGAPKSGFAFGELWLASRGHAVNCALHVNPDDSLKFQAYEPQLSGQWQVAFTPLTLAPEEYPLVQLVKFQ